MGEEGQGMRRGFIFAAGSFYGLREQPKTDDIVIAADAGLQHCREAGVRPDIILGDFDSLEALPETEAEIRRLPVEKDDTDTLAAVRAALAEGCGKSICTAAQAAGGWTTRWRICRRCCSYAVRERAAGCTATIFSGR